MWYNVDFKRFSVLILPTFLRFSRMIKWVNLQVFPLEKIHKSFLQNRTENIIKVTHNSQVCRLRKVLNDRFDNQQRRIYIDDANLKNPWYVYTKGENKPQYLGKKYIYQNSLINGIGVDFIVYVPAGLSGYEAELIAKINFYKLASKRFKIEYFL